MNEQTAYTIRPARSGDDQAIRAAVRRARLDRSGLDWGNFKVAETAAGEMIGFCQVRRYRGVRELGSLYVRKRWRRQGIGAALIRACLAGQAPPVHLECVADRQSYYQRFGFRRIPNGQAPGFLRVKSMVGLVVIWLLLRKQIIVMRWDGYQP